MKARKIFVASSYRNIAQEAAVIKLRQYGNEVYDFRSLDTDGKPFSWESIDPAYKTWKLTDYRQNLVNPKVLERYKSAYDHMLWAEVCILLNPAGNSSHLIAGWFIGQKKPCIIVLDPAAEPELMNKLAGFNLAVDLDNAISMLEFLP